MDKKADAPEPGAQSHVEQDGDQTKDDPTAGPPSGPDGAAKKETGVGCLIVAAFVGLIFGGTLGFFVAWGVAGMFISVLATVGGAMVGGAAGGFLADRIRQRSRKENDGSSGDG